MAETLKDVLADPLYFADIDDVGDIAKVISGEPGVKFVRVFGADGRLLVDTEQLGRYPIAPVDAAFGLTAIRDRKSVLRLSGDTLEIASPIDIGREAIGGVQLGFSTDSVEAEIRAITTQRIQQFFVLIFAGTGVSYVMAQHLVRPLRRLVGATQKVAAGEFEFSAWSQRSDELGELTHAFAHMTSRLQAFRTDVEERTGELEAANEKLQLEIAERKRVEGALRESEEAQREQAKERAVLAEIGRIISSSLDIDEVYEPFVEEVRKLIPSERIGISTIDLGKGELTVAYVEGIYVQARRRGTVIPLAGTVGEEIARTRSGLLIQPQDRAEVTARFRLLPHFDAGIRSFLSAPLISRNEVIGTLLLWSTEPNRYSERDLALAERIGSQIAGAITNSQLYADRARAESALIQDSHDLAKSNGELEQFAYVASHDLQEPLRMVSSYTQLLARRYRGQLDSDADDFISFAVDGAQRMQKLIEDLLEYSRIGSRVNAPEPTNLEEVLDAALANLTAAIEESGAEVTKDPLPTLSVDASQLTQLFQNLIGNALKFRREAPQVHVSAVTEENLVTFSVRDNGIGIQSDYVERVFAIFQRLHTRDEYAGTGIGLAVCRRIVERHDGRIWVESEPGVGTTFYFTLPRPVPNESTHAAPA